MTVALIDDQLLGRVLRGTPPRVLSSSELYTTGHWYVRLCQAVLSASDRTEVLSRPFAELPPDLRTRATNAVLELPTEIGLLSLRDLAPRIAHLRQHHRLNFLGIEVLAAASLLGAHVFLSANAPMLEDALRHEQLTVKVVAQKERGAR